MSTDSIGSGATRDHADVDAWDTALPATFTQDEIGQCYNDSEFGSFVIAGHDPNGFIFRLEAAPGEGFADHATAATNQLNYDQSKGVGFKETATYTILADISDKLHVKGLQFYHAGTNTVASKFLGGSTADAIGMVFENLIIRATSIFPELENGAKIINCCLIMEDEPTGSNKFIHLSLSGGVAFTNCTIIAPEATSKSNAPVKLSWSADADFRGCAFFGWDGDLWAHNSGGTSHTVNFVSCVTGFTSLEVNAADTTGSLFSKTDTDQFENFTNEILFDGRLKSGADCIDASGRYTETGDKDIIGQDRGTANHDAGCWEFQTTEANLAIGDGAHSQTTDAFAFAQVHDFLAIQAGHAESTDPAGFQQLHTLATSQAGHVELAELAALTQFHLLGIGSAVHVNIAAVATFGSPNQLTIQQAAHAHLADLESVAQIHDLLVALGEHASIADAAGLVQVHSLVLQAGNHVEVAEQVGFVIDLTFSPATGRLFAVPARANATAAGPFDRLIDILPIPRKHEVN